MNIQLLKIIKERVLAKLNIHISEFMIRDKNPNSPAGLNDNRYWYLCKLCDHANLSKLGITIHLAKYHHISSCQNKEKIIELAITETINYMK